MSETGAAGPPAWVTKRDGRLEPFEADTIAQALFAATETLGAPNAFLARELTDAVIHFLSADPAGPAPTTAHIAEQVVKVVRELGQPELAQVFAGAPRTDRPSAQAVAFSFTTEESPAGVARRCLAAYGEQAVFARDLIAARDDGLLVLAGLDTPRQLARCVLEAMPATWAEVPEACAVAGQGLVIDGPEWREAEAAQSSAHAVIGWLNALPALTRRHVVINLNAAQPPAWAHHRGSSPLFASEAPANLPLLDTVLDEIPLAPAAGVRWDWHVQGRDFAEGPHRDRLRRLARHALDGRPVAFVFDRPRRAVALAEGMDRHRPAVLVEVGLDLAAFAQRPGIVGSVTVLRDKLPSLARMAVSAGAQKRKYLRRHAGGTPLERGFLLDRARLAVVPLGLPAVVRGLTGHSAAADRSALELARGLLERLSEGLQEAGRAAHLEVVLDSPGPGFAAAPGADGSTAAALGGADEAVPPERQVAAAGVLHAVAGRGTAHVCWPGDLGPTPDGVLALLSFAWRRTEVLRMIVQRPGRAVAQPEFDV